MSPDYKYLVKAALQEDLPNGDLTSDLLRFSQAPIQAQILAKEDLVLCGIDAVNEVCHQVDSRIKITWHFAEGQLLLNKQVAASLSGPPASIMKAERTALNFLGFMSGISTLTRCFVHQMEGTGCQILDTRKTRPGQRHIEKYAVKIGGGHNHRMNLSDAILVKENHLRCSGGLVESLRTIQEHSQLPIEVEVTDLDELKAALEFNVHRVLLDNMGLDDMEKAVELCPPHVETEASGNMTLERVSDVAKTGVNFISVGALTHSAPCADFSLLVIKA